jgi:hypothetical protein
MLGVALVASKYLVPAIATNHHLHMLRRFLGQIPGGEAGWVGKGLVHIGHDTREVIVETRRHGQRAIAQV